MWGLLENNNRGAPNLVVIPAQAGIQAIARWIPAFAGMTEGKNKPRTTGARKLERLVPSDVPRLSSLKRAGKHEKIGAS
jgi:hypothetical protein